MVAGNQDKHKTPRLPEPPIARPCMTHWFDHQPDCEECWSKMWEVREQPATVAVYRPTGRVYVHEEVAP
jgi:hypothetical protein